MLLKAKLFQNGQSQAVRLPKSFRFPGKEVLIQKVGDGVMLTPVKHSWDQLLAALDDLPEDFMNDRCQPTGQQEREDL